MSARQIENCAAVITPTAAATFRAWMATSDALFERAIELRRAVWELYRERKGVMVKGKVRK
jgi:hypothetical protein